MTKKDYKIIASIIAKQEGDTILKDKLIEELSALLEDDNPRFDRDKFRKACYGGKL